jgi:DNA repair protein RecN (Recombination protein N)
VIDELAIEHLGVIEAARLELAPGLTVVTGETGAGKTLVVTALQLLLGARADSGLVRHGSEAAHVEARFTPAPPGAQDWLDDGSNELVVHREVRAEGRSRVRVGGRLATVGTLSEVLGPVVEVHAQDAHASLRRPEVQRALLDRFAGPAHLDDLAAHRELHAQLVAVVRRREELAGDERERLRTVDRLRYEVSEIEAAGLDPEVDGRLPAELAVHEHAEELVAALHGAAEAVGSEGAGEPLGVAVGALRRLPVADETLDRLRERAESLAAESADLAVELRGHAEDLDLDPGHLAQLRARERRLQELFRRYGDDVPAVLAHGATAADDLARLEALEADRDGLDGRVAELGERATATAATVTAGRRRAAADLATAVDGHLADLGMPHASFIVEVAPGELGHDGADRVRYLLAANPGEPPAAVDRAASGGERSRVALAIEVALADVEGADVLVFDEVDAGIGGATALAVGEKLRRLAHGAHPRQVLCVTHLAQLAAYADVHHVVEKQVVDGRTTTRVRRVAEEQRVAEVARMLGGDPDGDAGRAHAATLLERAGVAV